MPARLQVADLPIRGRLAPGAMELALADRGLHPTLRGIVHLVNGESPLAYVKLLSTRRLINEFVASQLARALSLLSPAPYLVLVDPADYGEVLGRLGHEGGPVLGFGTRALAGNPLSKRLNLDDASHSNVFFKYLKQWQAIAAFDSWIGNEDRHRANIVLDDRLQVWAIDHEQSLGCDTPFTSLQAHLPRKNRFLEEHRDKLALRLKHEASDIAQELMRKAGVIDLAGEVSDSGVPGCMLIPDVDALVLYVEQRLAIVDELVCESLGIPKLFSPPS